MSQPPFVVLVLIFKWTLEGHFQPFVLSGVPPHQQISQLSWKLDVVLNVFWFEILPVPCGGVAFLWTTCWSSPKPSFNQQNFERLLKASTSVWVKPENVQCILTTKSTFLSIRYGDKNKTACTKQKLITASSMLNWKLSLWNRGCPITPKGSSPMWLWEVTFGAFCCDDLFW